VVFFLQFPCLDWPATRWYGKKTATRSRADQTVWGGIDRQFGELRRRLDAGPGWPGPGPYRHGLLRAVGRGTVGCAERWMDGAAAPTTPLVFEPERHLRDAAVGVAIWSW